MAIVNDHDSYSTPAIRFAESNQVATACRSTLRFLSRALVVMVMIVSKS